MLLYFYLFISFHALWVTPLDLSWVHQFSLQLYLIIVYYIFNFLADIFISGSPLWFYCKYANSFSIMSYCFHYVFSPSLSFWIIIIFLNFKLLSYCYIISYCWGCQLFFLINLLFLWLFISLMVVIFVCEFISVKEMDICFMGVSYALGWVNFPDKFYIYFWLSFRGLNSNGPFFFFLFCHY